MASTDPGKFWKTPFIWEPGCPQPMPATLSFEPVDTEWLPHAVASVMAASVDETDQFAVDRLGALGAAHQLLAVASADFEVRPGWWRMARDKKRDPVGFVLPVLFRGEKTWRYGQPEGTIFYIGVLPSHRGRGHGAQLLAEATRVAIAANCWRNFCDTSSRNEPMIRAFRSAGYKELAPWQRPIE